MEVKSYITRQYLFVICSICLFCGVNISSGLGIKNALCKQVSPCKCLYPNGEGIDLSPVLTPSESFSFLTVSNTSAAYYFHPCSDSPLNSFNSTPCTNAVSLCAFVSKQNYNTTINPVAILSQNDTSGQFYKLASATDASFDSTIYKDNNIRLIYTTSNGSIVVNLECSTDTKPVLKLEPSVSNTFTLSSLYSCKRTIEMADTTPSHVSGGSVFVIIFFTLFGCYFIVGALVRKFVMGATGIEMIPNLVFWSNLISLVKDGMIFTFTCGRYDSDSYERI